MVEVMSRVHSHNVGNRLLATFGMHTMVLPELLRHGFEQGKIAVTEDPEHSQRFSRIAIRIIESLRPDVLIERLNWRTITPQDQTNPPSTNQLRIRQVCQNLCN